MGSSPAVVKMIKMIKIIKMIKMIKWTCDLVAAMTMTPTRRGRRQMITIICRNNQDGSPEPAEVFRSL